MKQAGFFSLSFLVRRWEVVAAALILAMGWAHFTHRPIDPPKSAHLVIQWESRTGQAPGLLLPGLERETPLGSLQDVENLLRSPDFLEFVARETVLALFEQASNPGGRATSPVFDLGREEALSRFGQFASTRDDVNQTLRLSFEAATLEEAEGLTRSVGKTLLRVHAASVNRKSVDVRDFIRSRLDEWTDLENRSTRAIWALRGSAQVASSGKVASKPGGPTPDEQAPAAASTPLNLSDYRSAFVLLGAGFEEGATETPLADPPLEACRRLLQEARRLEVKLLDLVRELEALDRLFQESKGEEGTIALWLQDLNRAETELLRLREVRRSYEAAFREFDLAPPEAPEAPFSVASRTSTGPGATDAPNRLRHYRIWAVYGAVVGVVLARWLDSSHGAIAFGGDPIEGGSEYEGFGR